MAQTQNVTISVAPGIKALVDAFAEQAGMKRSDILRLALYQFLNVPQKLMALDHTEMGVSVISGRTPFNTAGKCKAEEGSSSGTFRTT